MSVIVGIDLGTTNSLVAVWERGAARIIPNALGENLTPSCVSVDDQGRILVGRAARERLLTHPRQTAAVFKRYMGTKRAIQLGEVEYRPEELSSFVLRALKADAEAYLGEVVEEAIITVPAYFSDAQRKATRAAGELAGLRVERLLNEPTAAALAYGVAEAKGDSKFLVFDLGGGTFDVSVLDLFENVMEVRASAGDNFLGGEDFVELLVNDFMDQAARPGGAEPESLGPALQQLLRARAEAAKRVLSLKQEAEIRLTVDGREISHRIDRERFATMSMPLMERLRLPVERALRDARISASTLDIVVLAGGATRMPIVQSLVSRMFGRLPARHINPDEVVALGAAVQAGRKMRDVALDEIVMTDTCPYTLGIEVVARERPGPTRYTAGHYLPIIERNTVVPVSRSESVVTTTDNQEIFGIKIYQGESRLVADNIFLGQIDISIPRRPEGEVGADVRFTYDINGLLEVEATIAQTGERRTVVIEKNPGVMSKEDIARRLQELTLLKLHPRVNARNAVLIARGNRMYQELLGEKRDSIGRAVSMFEAALQQQDQREIGREREKLDKLLDAIEKNGYWD